MVTREIDTLANLRIYGDLQTQCAIAPLARDTVAGEHQKRVVRARKGGAYLRVKDSFTYVQWSSEGRSHRTR